MSKPAAVIPRQDPSETVAIVVGDQLRIALGKLDTLSEKFRPWTLVDRLLDDLDRASSER